MLIERRMGKSSKQSHKIDFIFQLFEIHFSIAARYRWKSPWFFAHICWTRRKRKVSTIRIWLFARRFPPCSNADNNAAERRYTNLSAAIFLSAPEIGLSDAPERYQGQGRSAFRCIDKSHQSPKSKIGNWYSPLFDKSPPRYRHGKYRIDSTSYPAAGKSWFVASCLPRSRQNRLHRETGFIAKVEFNLSAQR